MEPFLSGALWGSATVPTTPSSLQEHTYDLIRGEAEGLLVGRSVGWRQGWQGGGLQDHRAVWGVLLTAQDIRLLPAGAQLSGHLPQ